jgi:hypothetical protein
MRVPYATPRILHLVRQHICRRHSSRRPPGRAEGHWPASATPAPIPWVCLYRWSPKKQKSSWSRRGRAGSLAVATRRTPELPEGSRLSLQVAHWIGEQLKPTPTAGRGIRRSQDRCGQSASPADSRIALRQPYSWNRPVAREDGGCQSHARPHSARAAPQAAQGHHPATLQRPRGRPDHLGLASKRDRD